MQLTVSMARNNFPLLDAESYLLLAGGIGITPLLPMVEELRRSRRPWQLMYGARSRTAMAYADRLTERNDQISLWPENELGRLPLDAVLAGASPGTAVYCCGPTGMIEAVQERCDRRSDLTLHVERFAAARREDDADRDESFTLVLARSGLRLEVPAGQSILQVVEDAGLIVACSCCEGTCGTCETKIIEGDADHRDSVLTPAEHAAGDRLMICVSRARTPELVLDL
jgi:ferredoxin-NADP reductase